MIITLNIFLYLYVGILLIYALFAVFNLYHIFKFGLNRHIAFLGMFVFLGGVVVVLGISFFFIAHINWESEITLFDYSTNYLKSPYAQ